MRRDNDVAQIITIIFVCFALACLFWAIVT